MARRRGLQGLVAMCEVMAVTPGCFCLDLFGGANRAVPDDGAAVNPVFDDPRPECTQESALALDALLDAGVPSSATQGVSEVPISRLGCFRYVRVVDGGALVESSIQHLTGQYTVETDRDSGVMHGFNVDRVPLRMVYGPDSLTGTFDVDEDGVGALCGGTLCRSMAACRSGGGAGGGGCKSLSVSVSCDKACQ